MPCSTSVGLFGSCGFLGCSVLRLSDVGEVGFAVEGLGFRICCRGFELSEV